MSFCFKNYILLFICVLGGAIVRLSTQVPLMVTNSASTIDNFFLAHTFCCTYPIILSTNVLHLYCPQIPYAVLFFHLLFSTFTILFNLYPIFTFDEVFTSMKRHVYSFVYSFPVVLYISTNPIPLNYIPSLSFPQV